MIQIRYNQVPWAATWLNHIFTDGSALGNPGPSGASAIIYSDGLMHEPVKLSIPISCWSTSYHGELAAISEAAKYMRELCTAREPAQRPTAIHIFSDCQSALAAPKSSTRTILWKFHSSMTTQLYAHSASPYALHGLLGTLILRPTNSLMRRPRMLLKKLNRPCHQPSPVARWKQNVASAPSSFGKRLGGMESQGGTTRKSGRVYL